MTSVDQYASGIPEARQKIRQTQISYVVGRVNIDIVTAFSILVRRTGIASLSGLQVAYGL